MENDKILCPSCGSSDTLRIHGPFRLTAWVFHQRHECRDCGQLFMTSWEGEFLRTYSRRQKGELAHAR